jgi:5-(carboxyamino)imidazole ribonucleotide mutase
MSQPKVGIIMGSDSDLPVMQEAAKILQQFDIEFEMEIVSAHRTPQKMFEYAQTAQQKGVQVIIAGAGGAAHLPGMTSSLTTLPVIGVPVQTKTMKGIDSLCSIAQMPPGVPVATMAINGAKNAGLLAAQILALSDEKLAKKVTDYKQNIMEEVAQKNEKLVAEGFETYLENFMK